METNQKKLLAALCVLAIFIIAFSVTIEKSEKTHFHTDGVVYNWECPIYNRTRICFHYVKITNAPLEWETQECVIAIRGRSHVYEIGQVVSIGGVSDGQCVLYKCEGECPENISVYGSLLGLVAFVFFVMLVFFIKTFYPQTTHAQVSDVEIAERDGLVERRQ